MGKVVVKIKLTNYFELELKRRKLRKDKPRSVETEALVDTGATRLYLQCIESPQTKLDLTPLTWERNPISALTVQAPSSF